MKISEAKIFASVLALFEKQKSRLKQDIIEEIEIPEAVSITGSPGPKGDEGVPGRNAVDGKDGKDGSKGDTGDKGDRGSDGADGQDGAAGKDGTPGKPGLHGDSGNDGKDARDGNDGADGKDGKDGNKGKDGEPGTDGRDGVSGKDGNNGLQGNKGERGLRGLKGEKGDSGKIGNSGKAGTKGDDGKDGSDGKDGTDGVDGKNGTGFNENAFKLLKREFNHFRDISNRQMASMGGGGSTRILDMDDVNFNYPSQLANNDILTFDTNLSKFTALNIATIINNVKTQIDLEMQYDRLIEEVVVGANTFTYIGQADPGSVRADTVWRIKRIAEYANGTIEDAWSNDSDAFVRSWDDKLTYNYNI